MRLIYNDNAAIQMYIYLFLKWQKFHFLNAFGQELKYYEYFQYSVNLHLMKKSKNYAWLSKLAVA
jgi:hypothetical protein